MKQGQSKRQTKIYAMLGLAMKAGRIASGEFSTEKSVKSGKAWVVLVSEDASANTKKKFSNMCGFYEVPIYVFGTKALLGCAIGKEQRSSLAVTDENFARSITMHLQQAEGCEGRAGHRDVQPAENGGKYGENSGI